MRNIIAGAVLIGIGLFRHSSVFFGDFTVLNVLFDALGTYWIVKGVLGLVRSRDGATA